RNLLMRSEALFKYRYRAIEVNERRSQPADRIVEAFHRRAVLGHVSRFCARRSSGAPNNKAYAEACSSAKSRLWTAEANEKARPSSAQDVRESPNRPVVYEG